MTRAVSLASLLLAAPLVAQTPDQTAPPRPIANAVRVEVGPILDGHLDDAAWARATMDNWGLGGLAGDVGLIVAEFSSNADFRAATSAPLCLDWVLLLPGVLPGLRSFFRGRYPCRTWPG